MIRRLGLAAVAASMLLGVIHSPAQAADPSPRRIVSAWLPNWDTDASVSNVVANADLFTDAAPTWFELTAAGTTVSMTGTLSQAARLAARDRLRAAGLPVYPMVFDHTPRLRLAQTLADPATRRALVAQQTKVVVDEGYAGLDLDYEQFAFADGRSSWATTRPNWVTYVKELSASLAAAGKKLIVTTPGIYNSKQDSTSGYWVYDWVGIGPYVARLRVMTYDWSTSQAGPIAPLPWVVSTMRYAASVVPSWKVQMGIPAYGRDWISVKDGKQEITGTCPADNMPGKAIAFTASGANAWFAGRGVSASAYTYDDAQKERTVSYSRVYRSSDPADTNVCTVKRVAWWVDGRAAMDRIRYIDDLQLGGAAFWHGGGIDPAIWSPLRSYATSIAVSPTTVTLRAPYAAARSTTVTVRGTALSSRGAPTGAPVIIEAVLPGTSTWRRLGSTTVGADGSFAFTTPALTGPTSYRATAPSSWWRFAGTSPTATVLDRRKITGTAPAAVRRGATFTISAKLTPGARGVTVYRDIMRGGRWVRLGKTTTDSYGNARFAITTNARTPSILTYRLISASSGGFPAAASPRFSVRLG